MPRGRLAIALRRVLAPLAGLSAFWAYFRFPSLFGVLFPPGGSELLGVPAVVVLLGLLAALAAVCTAFSGLVQRAVEGRRPAVALVACLGSVGSALALFGQGDAARLAGASLSALAFVASFLMWARYCSGGLCRGMVPLLFGSCFLSVVLFSRLGPVAEAFSPAAVAVAVPTLSGACWLVALPGGGERETPWRGGSDARGLFNPLACLFACVLLVGSAVRGLVDAAYSEPYSRYWLSIPVYGSMLAFSAVWCAAGRRRDGRRESRPEGPGLDEALDGQVRRTRFILVCLALVLALFMAGLLAFMLAPGKEVSGGVVVMARSILDLVLWLLLCDVAHEGRAPYVPLFLIYSLLVEVLSWLLSYVVVPAVSAPGELYAGEGAALTAVLFGIIGAFAVALACAAAASDRLLVAASTWGSTWGDWEGGLDGAAPGDGRPASGGGRLGSGEGRLAHGGGSAGAAARRKSAEGGLRRDGRAAAMETLTRAHGLSEREAAVIWLYAQGLSYGKVADELGISRSTVQSHLRSAYRKLAVHTKDDLIELVREYGG